MIEVVNRQRKIKIGAAGWCEFAVLAANEVPEAVGKSLTVAFVSDRQMREFSRQFRGVNKTTDVLSFASEADEFSADENYAGDIAISLEQAQRQAEENDLDLETEIKQLILHGILHLCGYDHETDAGEMNEKELKLRDKLGI
ncbi:MAG: rRNA maturation RNase YbeY [Pyrinomonadaceae bacterium]|nr:rRNA maturation RNase YbeY [Pyrinomonadaceae bacterium]